MAASISGPISSLIFGALACGDVGSVLIGGTFQKARGYADRGA
jgi:hypothetical protein